MRYLTILTIACLSLTVPPALLGTIEAMAHSKTCQTSCSGPPNNRTCTRTCF